MPWCSSETRPSRAPRPSPAWAEARAAGHALVVLGFEPEDPLRYGRLVMHGDSLERIVEFKDATDEERGITLCNGGVTMAPAKLLAELVESLRDDNAAGEYYLTDIVALARAKGHSATAVTCDPVETMGVDTPRRTRARRDRLPSVLSREVPGDRRHDDGPPRQSSSPMTPRSGAMPWSSRTWCSAPVSP